MEGGEEREREREREREMCSFSARFTHPIQKSFLAWCLKYDRRLVLESPLNPRP